ncbi:MAG: flagellar basal body-associated FliL family protein [Hylemonella sp.]|jgi:flagellar FliL protein
MATAANAAPEEETGDEAEVKPKKSIVKIILGVVGLLVLLAGTVFGTLFFSGYFNPKPPVDPESAEAAEQGGNAKGKKDAKPSKLSKKSPEITRFDYQYMQIEKDFLVNLMNSKKVMSVSLALMTHYDERVFENVKKHELALRSAVLDVLRQVPESDINKPEFRVELARKIRNAMNSLLEKYEDFGGIEEVLYTNMVIQ